MRYRYVLAAAAALLVVRPAVAALGPRYGGELRVSIVGDATLEARAAEDPTGRFVGALLHETLLRLAPDGEALEPDLATSWSPGADGGEWVLTLAENLQFHDGAPLTASDAARSLKRFLRGGAASAVVLAERLEGGAAFRRRDADELPGLAIDAQDRLHLRFRDLTSWLDLLPLTSPAAAIVSDTGASCGAFVPTVTMGDERIFVPFGSHVRGRPYLDRVRVKTVDDGRRASIDRRLGRVQLAVGGIPPDGASAARTAHPALLLLVLDPRNPIFADAVTRQRVAQAIDRESLVSRLLRGAEATTGLLARPSRPDAERAVAVSAAATSPPRGRITLAVDRSLSPLISQRIIAHLAAIGIGANAHPSPAGALIRSAADARLLVFEPELSEDALLLHELATLAPEAGIDALAAATEANVERRQELALAVERRWLASGTIIPLARVWRHADVADTLHGLSPGAAAPSLEDAWIEP